MILRHTDEQEVDLLTQPLIELSDSERSCLHFSELFLRILQELIFT